MGSVTLAFPPVLRQVEQYAVLDLLTTAISTESHNMKAQDAVICE